MILNLDKCIQSLGAPYEMHLVICRIPLVNHVLC